MIPNALQICIVSLSASDTKTVARLCAALPQARHHRVDTVRDIAGLFSRGKTIIGVCSAGILIRAVAGSLGNKKTDPPVLALADDCSVIVPLLGGHHGGNALAKSLGAALGAFPAITTASELRLNFDFEAPPPGLALAGDHKAFVASALRGAKISVDDSIGLKGEHKAFLDSIPNQHLTGKMRARKIKTGEMSIGEIRVYVGHRPKPGCLSYIPQTTVLGVGASRNCPPEELAALVSQCLIRANRHPASVTAVASHQLKSDETAVLHLAQTLNVTSHFYTTATLNRHRDRLSQQSETVFKETGCWGVAEAAALEAAKTDRLLLVKQKSAMATCAIAETGNV